MATAGTTSTGGEFGQSAEFGDRLAPSPPWRDLWAGIGFILHVIVIIVVIIYYWASFEISATFSGNETWTAIFVSMAIALVVAIIFGLLWLQLMKMYPEMIIKLLLGLNILLWIVAGVALYAAFGDGGLYFMIVCLLVAAILCLYTWCIWKRIPFASALLSVATRIIQTYEGTIIVSIIVTIFQFAWVIVWVMLFISYIIACIVEGNDVNSFVIFLLLISLYWGLNVFRNVSHCTSCGVAATWFFNAGVIEKPSWKALGRSMTTSFGSICLGSFIVAVLQATRAMCRSMKRSVLGCIVICILICIEWLIRYFNMYAFAHCAIYGCSFLQAAKQTWNLFSSKGFDAIINDDLTGIALVSGCAFGAIASYLAAVGIIFALGSDDYHDYKSGGWTTKTIQTSVTTGYVNGQPVTSQSSYTGNVYTTDYSYLPWILGIISFYVGYMMVSVMMYCVRSGVVTLFTCFSEDPAAMQANRPEEYNMFVTAKAEINTFVQQFNVGPSQPQPGVQNA